MRGAWRFAPAALLVLTAACGTETIPIASFAGDAGVVEAGGDAQIEAEAGMPCMTNADCRVSHTFCSIPDCKSCFNGACVMPTAGTCLPIPDSCPSDDSPVCGCDLVTYFNDCLRRTSGVAASASGACPLSPSCFPRRTGPPDPQVPPCPGVCAYIEIVQGLGSECQDTYVPPTCWILPDRCPDKTIHFVDGCEDRTVTCRGLCQAIASGGGYYQFSSPSACH
ncbi:MAG TPA: hypothetical protein VKU41_01195 [Polyangiaceae bacterium]|nr:hypothetical protein [Polyangiaceae bacterium]